MSRSTRNEITESPVKYYVQWSGGTEGLEGKFKIYDKETNKKTTRDKLEFLVLDRRATVRGYKNGKSIYANQVKNTTKQPLKVMKDGNKSPIVEGLWQDIKNDVKAEGGSYATVLYIKIKGDNNISTLTLNKSALNAWIEFTSAEGAYEGKDKPDIYREGIAVLKRSELQEQGTNKWYNPVFSTFEVSEKEDEQAIELDEKLKEYFEARGEAFEDVERDGEQAEETEEEEDFTGYETATVTEETAPPSEEDDLPF